MKYIKSISIFLIILSLMFLGCVQKPTGTPTPTPVETVATATPTPSPSPSPTPVKTSQVRNASTYKVFVNDYYGFNRVIETEYRPIIYENLTLNIYAGDKVIWQNDAFNDEQLTIISEQNLWDNSSAILRYTYDKFEYNFTNPGTYRFYIKEYRRLGPQTIKVVP